MVEVNHCVIIFKSASEKAYCSTTTVCDDVKFFIFSMFVLYFIVFHNTRSCTYVLKAYVMFEWKGKTEIL